MTKSGEQLKAIQLNNQIKSVEQAILERVAQIYQLGTLPTSLNELQVSLNTYKDKLQKITKSIAV